MGAAERRVVSVVFADLVDFTALSERLDAEDVAHIQDSWFALAAEAVDDRGAAPRASDLVEGALGVHVGVSGGEHLRYGAGAVDERGTSSVGRRTEALGVAVSSRRRSAAAPFSWWG